MKKYSNASYNYTSLVNFRPCHNFTLKYQIGLRELNLLSYLSHDKTFQDRKLASVELSLVVKTLGFDSLNSDSIWASKYYHSPG